MSEDARAHVGSAVAVEKVQALYGAQYYESDKPVLGDDKGKWRSTVRARPSAEVENPGRTG